MSQSATTPSKGSTPITTPKSTPAKTNLNSLPNELKIEILSQFNSRPDTLNLMLASRPYNEAFDSYPEQIVAAVDHNRVHDSTALCHELIARGLDGIHDLLNPDPFRYFDLITPKCCNGSEILPPTIVSAVRTLVLQARNGEPIDLCADHRAALREVVAVAGEDRLGLFINRDVLKICCSEDRWRARTRLPFGAFDPEKHIWWAVWDSLEMKVYS